MSTFNSDQAGPVGGVAGGVSGGGGGAALGGLGFGQAKARSLRLTQGIMIALLVGVSGALLFAMNKIVKKTAIDFDGAAFESFTPDAKLQQEYEEVMASLRSAQTPVQLALLDLPRGPFVQRYVVKPAQQTASTPQTTIAPVAAAPGESEAQRTARLIKQRQQQVLAELSKLTLHSVMGGRRPIAKINEELVTVGDMVADQFTVVSIEGRSVTLQAYDANYVLEMGVPAAGGATPSTGQRRPNR